MASLLTKSLPLPGSRLGANDVGEIDGSHHILICMLGDFRVFKAGQPIRIAGGSKAETLLCSLALRQEYGALRDVLLATLWPNTESALAAQSLNSLVYDLHKRLGDGIGRRPLILYADGAYRLNVAAGVGIDVMVFDSLTAAGRKSARAGDHSSAVAFYTRALKSYGGDLRAGTDVHAIMERERLRALYLTALAYVADYHYAHGDYAACLDHSLALLASDPFREDAHRLVMRCCVRRGERAQALRQYRLCEEILLAEFAAAPEASTRALYDLIRLDPGSV